MVNAAKRVDYERSVEIAKGIFWVGFYDSQSGLHCNPYLIVDRDEAVVIDGGSRPDFPTVMMKILQTGVFPNQISALIYVFLNIGFSRGIHQHRDLMFVANPDECPERDGAGRIRSNAGNKNCSSNGFIQSPMQLEKPTIGSLSNFDDLSSAQSD